MVNDLHKRVKERFEISKEKVDFIISNEITDKNHIEGILDNLIADSLLGYGRGEFRKLNKYYSQIDKKNSNLYSQLFETILKSD